MTVDYKHYPVLFVDDEPQNLVVFRYAMEEYFTILTARSGAEALEFLRRQPIGVLLSDQRMPGMSGVELCAKAREIQPDAMRIIVTAYADIHAAVAAINDGQVSRYLVKPWRNQELIDALRSCIDQVHAQHTMRDMEQGLLKTGQNRIATAVHDELLHEVANPLGAMTMTLFQTSEMIDALLQRVESATAATLPQIKADVLELREAHTDAIAAVEQLNALAARMRSLHAADPGTGICDAGRVVDATVRILRRDVERTAKLEVAIERAPFVRVDASALGQIVLNLVLNAAQAIEGSGLTERRIRISVEAAEETAVLAVADDGPGIPTENLNRIFQPYFTTKATGTGLGLSIVREMVRRVGGQISVTSVPNDTTVFRVVLPGAKPV